MPTSNEPKKAEREERRTAVQAAGKAKPRHEPPARISEFLDNTIRTVPAFRPSSPFHHRLTRRQVNRSSGIYLPSSNIHFLVLSPTFSIPDSPKYNITNFVTFIYSTWTKLLARDNFCLIIRRQDLSHFAWYSLISLGIFDFHKVDKQRASLVRSNFRARESIILEGQKILNRRPSRSSEGCST